jgi:hypothetical protein
VSGNSLETPPSGNNFLFLTASPILAFIVGCGKMKVWMLSIKLISRLVQYVAVQCPLIVKLVPFVLVKVREVKECVVSLIRYVSIAGLLLLFHSGVKSKVEELFAQGNVRTNTWQRSQARNPFAGMGALMTVGA